MAATSPTSSRWMYGPVPDLLLGCGAGYAVLFAVFVAFGPEVQAALPLVYLAAIAFLISIPHYGATLLRAYERPTGSREPEIPPGVTITGDSRTSMPA